MKNKGIILAILGILVYSLISLNQSMQELTILESRGSVTTDGGFGSFGGFRVVSSVSARAVACQHLVETAIYSALYVYLSCSMYLGKQAMMGK